MHMHKLDSVACFASSCGRLNLNNIKKYLLQQISQTLVTSIVVGSFQWAINWRQDDDTSYKKIAGC